MEELADSWVEIGSQRSGRGTPSILPSAGEEYLRLLREAQRESSLQSSARQSLASSGRTSPKSPPNSPNTEPSTEDELKAVEHYLYGHRDGDLSSAEWVWQWSSRPDQLPPKDWKFKHPTSRGASLSLRRARISGRSLFSRELLPVLLVSNMLSMFIGIGIGVWLSRKGTNPYISISLV